MNNIRRHAETELNILFDLHPDHLIIHFRDEILNLCDKFGDSGQSGSSAPYTASSLSNVIKKLCLFETITPIMNSDDEWVNVYDNIYQNKRCSGLFKDGKDPKQLDDVKNYYNLDISDFREEKINEILND